MTKILNYTVTELDELGGRHTACEITGQPDLWLETWQKVKSEADGALAFLERAFSHEKLNIVLTGAGTSAYIGEVAEPLLRKHWPRPVSALPTTTLVTSFEQYVDTDSPLLLVSFARSGNSPESVATVKLAEQLCKQEVFHLVITCNSEGSLARETGALNSCLFLLPPEAEDQSLAMTGSFSSMVLAVLLMSRLSEIDQLEQSVERLAQLGRDFIDRYTDDLQELAGLGFQRAVFLGSGPRLGMARESHLKLQELTDGKVICKYDSFLGFRHGPKAVIDDRTLLVYLFSGGEPVFRYESDLAKSIMEKGFGMKSVGVFVTPTREKLADIDMTFAPKGNELHDQQLLPILSVLPAQILGFFSSIEHGLQPDAPSASGAISRVVEGVTIYPHQPKQLENF